MAISRRSCVWEAAALLRRLRPLASALACYRRRRRLEQQVTVVSSPHPRLPAHALALQKREREAGQREDLVWGLFSCPLAWHCVASVLSLPLSFSLTTHPCTRPVAFTPASGPGARWRGLGWPAAHAPRCTTQSCPPRPCRWESSSASARARNPDPASDHGPAQIVWALLRLRRCTSSTVLGTWHEERSLSTENLL